MSLHSEKNPSKKSSGKFSISDPNHRKGLDLLKRSQEKRSSDQISESVILAYLSLKAAVSVGDKTLEARSHLLLSELLGLFDYRGMERIHAKEAYRIYKQNNAALEGLESGEFYFRLGVVNRESGEFTIAEYYFELALNNFLDKQSNNKPSAVLTLMELARLSLLKADLNYTLDNKSAESLTRASEYIDRALALEKETNGDQAFVNAIYELQAQMILRLSAHLPSEKKEMANKMLVSAAKMLGTQIGIRRSEPGGALREQIPLLISLMSIHRQFERFVEAMDVSQELLKITDQLQRVNVDVTLNMALVAKNLNQEEAVRTLCNIVMNGEEARIAEFAKMSSEAIALAYGMQSRHRSMKCLAMLSTMNLRDQANTRSMFDLVLRRKSTITDSEAVFWNTLYIQPDEDLVNQRKLLVSARNHLSNKIVSGNSEGLWQIIQNIERGEEFLSVEPKWRDFNKLGNEKEKNALKGYAEALLEGQSSWDAITNQKHNFIQESINLKSVAAKMPLNSALVEFIKINDFDIKRDILLESAHYWALVLLPDGTVKTANLGAANKLESEIIACINLLHSSDRLDADPQLKAVTKLYELVWSPFCNYLANVENIILSQDAITALVPFGAVLGENNQFLIERFTFYQIITGRELVENGENIEQPIQQAVIFANPDFDAIADILDKDPKNQDIRSPIGTSLSPLNETLKEGEEVKQLLGGDTELITGKDASEARIREIENPRILHLATHGVFLAPPEIPEQVINKEDSVALNSAYTKHVQMLSRSGLAFSGINNGGIESGYEGLLTAFDVSGLNLSGTELVVLSACDSGLGEIFAGEGVMGLRRSFQIAGARYILMSLWRLSDKEARRQMQMFYKDFVAGRNPVLALRDTQLKRISRLRKVYVNPPPALWGALTIQGAPKN